MSGSITWAGYPDWRLAVMKFSGEIDDEQLVRSVIEAFSSVDFNPEWHLLADLRALDASPITASGLQAVAAISRAKRDGTATRPKTALVASRAFPYGLGRQYQAFATAVPVEIQVFTEPSAALEWLGIPDFPME